MRLRNLLVVWSILALASQGLAQGCEGWNTSVFFLAVTPAEVRACLATGADVNARAAVLDHTPLHLAVRFNNNPAIIEVLLDAGADATARDLSGNTPWDYARDREGLKGSDAYRRLSEAQAVAADCTGWNTREFFESATSELVAVCLTAGAEVNARDRHDITPLHWAAQLNDNPAVTTALLEAGAEVDARDVGGWAPLDYAARSNTNPAVITALLAAGAEVDARAGDGWVPLDYAACCTDNPAVITALLEAGAEVDARNRHGLTPLHWAAQLNDNPAVTTALLEAGAEVDARDMGGWAPLDYATLLTDNPAVIRAAVITTLLDAGADAATQDAEGLTPWDYAQINEGLEGIDAYWRLYEGSLE